MSSSSLDEPAMTSSSGGTRDVKRVLRLNTAKPNLRYFGIRCKEKEPEKNNATNLEAKDSPLERLSSTKISSGFLKNIKERLCVKKLNLCKVKKKIIGIDSQCENVDTLTLSSEKISIREKNDVDGGNERVTSVDSVEASLQNRNDERSENEGSIGQRVNSTLEDRCRDEGPITNDESSKELRLEFRDEDKYGLQNENINSPLETLNGNIAEPQSTVGRESTENIDIIDDAQISNENKAKVSLFEELLKLSKYGWYWGPISGDEADLKLASEPDGAFLVRDSSDDRYLLTLSFKASGKMLHARMEHSGGFFSLWNPGDNEKFTSVAALIDHSMNFSESAVYCYSRPKYPGSPSFPVRLTKPVSRFTQVRSLQYLCRFVIRQNTTLDNIHKLPLPKTIIGYIEEAHY